MNRQLSRRNMILGAAAAAGATWFDLPRVLAAQLKESHAKYGGFGMGIQSYSLRGFDFDTTLDKIAELGLNYVEFFNGHYPNTLDPAVIKATQAKLDAHGLECNCHGVQGFSTDHEKNEEFFKFAKLAGIRTISADFGPEAHESLNTLVAKYQIRIAAHNHGPGHRWDKIDDMKNQIRGLHPLIGACADLGHYIRSGQDPVEVIYAYKGRLFGIHLKDFQEQKRDSKGCILGKGHLDVAGVFKALKDVQFPADGALSLEYEENPDNPMADLKACYAVAEEAAKKLQ